MELFTIVWVNFLISELQTAGRKLNRFVVQANLLLFCWKKNWEYCDVTCLLAVCPGLGHNKGVFEELTTQATETVTETEFHHKWPKSRHTETIAETKTETETETIALFSRPRLSDSQSRAIPKIRNIWWLEWVWRPRRRLRPRSIDDIKTKTETKNASDTKTKTDIDTDTKTYDKSSRARLVSSRANTKIRSDAYTSQFSIVRPRIKAEIHRRYQD